MSCKSRSFIPLLFKCLSVLLICVGTANPSFAKIQPPVPPAASLFFQSLIQAIDHVEGRFFVEMQNGTIVTHINGLGALGDVKWVITSGTTASLDLRYDGGVLAGRNKISFSPSVNITPNPGSPIPSPHSISAIEFDELGVPSKYVNSLGQEDTGIKGFPNVQQQLTFTNSLPDVFVGQIFRTLNPTLAAAPTPLPLIKRIGFQKGVVPPGSNPIPGLKVTLKDQSILIFTQATAANPFDNSVTVEDQSGFEFDNIIYDVQAKSVDGALAKLAFNVQSGKISSNGVDFRLAKGTELSFTNLTFHHDESGNDEIRGTLGKIKAGLGIGTKLLLGTEAAPNPSWLSFDDGSQVILRSFAVKFTNSTTEISAGSASSIVIRVVDGRLSLGATNYALIRDGLVVADITAANWKEGSDPHLKAIIGLLACDIYAGEFKIGNSGTMAALKGGTIRSSDLKLDAAGAPPVTGKFSSFVLDLQDGTTFRLEGRFTAVLRDGGRLTADDPTAPLTLSTGSTPITGSFVAALPFRKVATSDPEGPVVRNGHLRSTIIINVTGAITATDVYVDGQINLTARVFNKDVETQIDVLVENGRWSISNGQPLLEADFQATISMFGFAFTLKAPECPLYGVARMDDIHRGHIKFLIYPVDFAVALNNKPVTIPPSKLFLAGKKISISSLAGSFNDPKIVTTSDSELSFSVLAARFIDEDDEFKASWPHFLKADCISFGLGSSNDVRLRPDTYNAPFNLTLESSGDGIDVKVHPRFPLIAVNLDTCFADGISLGIILPLAFALNPFGTIDAINRNSPGALIQRALNEKLAQKPFHFGP